MGRARCAVAFEAGAAASIPGVAAGRSTGRRTTWDRAAGASTRAWDEAAGPTTWAHGVLATCVTAGRRACAAASEIDAARTIVPGLDAHFSEIEIDIAAVVGTRVRDRTVVRVRVPRANVDAVRDLVRAHVVAVVARDRAIVAAAVVERNATRSRRSAKRGRSSRNSRRAPRHA